MTPETRKAIEGILAYFNSGNALPVEKATIRGDSPEIKALRAALEQPAVEPVQTLIAKLQADPDYAWSWHCSIAMAYVDAGGDPYTGNQGAARFMKMFANVDPAHELPAPRNHVTDGSACWCHPEVVYTDSDTGASVIVHKEPQ